MSEEELRERIRVIGGLMAENKAIAELKDEKIGLNLDIALKLTRTLQETTQLEVEVAEARRRLERAKKPIIKVRI